LFFCVLTRKEIRASSSSFIFLIDIFSFLFLKKKLLFMLRERNFFNDVNKKKE